MSARRFPCYSCLVTVVKPGRAWLLVLHCSTFQWWPPGQPSGFHLAMGSVPAWMLHMCAPPKTSIKEACTASLGSLSVSHRLGCFMDRHISCRRC